MFPIIQYSLFWKGAQYFLHHGQVFSVVMSLEEGESQIELEHDTANAPDITRLRPAKFCGKTELVWWEILNKYGSAKRIMICIYDFYPISLPELCSVGSTRLWNGVPNRRWLNRNQSTGPQCFSLSAHHVAEKTKIPLYLQYTDIQGHWSFLSVK